MSTNRVFDLCNCGSCVAARGGITPGESESVRQAAAIRSGSTREAAKSTPPAQEPGPSKFLRTLVYGALQDRDFAQLFGTLAEQFSTVEKARDAGFDFSPKQVLKVHDFLETLKTVIGSANRSAKEAFELGVEFGIVQAAKQISDGIISGEFQAALEPVLGPLGKSLLNK